MESVDARFGHKTPCSVGEQCCELPLVPAGERDESKMILVSTEPVTTSSESGTANLDANREPE